MGDKPMTAADAAKLVKRKATERGEDGKPVTKEVAVRASEVLAFGNYGTHVVVVTTDGQKLRSAG
jgi:hypothetical protein